MGRRWSSGKRVLFAALVAASIAGGAPSAQAIDLGPKATYLVRISPSARTAIENGIKMLGGTVETRYSYVFDGFKIKLPVAAATALSKIPNVLTLEPDVPVAADADPAQLAPPSWGLDRIDQREIVSTAAGYVGRYGYKSAGVGSTIYVVDTGVSPHSDLEGRLSDSGYSAIADGNGITDCKGHGTHVASTAAGTTYGVAKKARVVSVRVLDCGGSGSVSGVIAGLDWILSPLNPNPKTQAVINMSLGGGASSSLDAAVLRLTNAGISVAVAAGNSNVDACGTSPARAPSAITVGATSRLDSKASFSNWGPCVDISAPGVDITGAWFDGPTSTRTISGTSMATPHVTGAVAVALGVLPGASVSTITAYLDREATMGAITGLSGATPNKLLYVSPTDGAPPVVAPTVSFETVTGITHAAATVALRASAGGADTAVRLEYSTDRNLTSGVRTAVVGTASGYDPVVLSTTLTDLAPATTYWFRAIGDNDTGTSSTPVGSFTTLPPPVVPPTLTLGATTEVTAYSARLTGTVAAGNATATVSFVYSTDPTFGTDAKTIAASPSVVSGNAPTAVSAPIGFLDGSRTYYVRLAVSNPTATTVSPSASFTTPPSPGLPPVVATDVPRGLRTAEATITGTVDPQGQTTEVRLVYSRSSSLTTGATRVLVPGGPITGMGPQPVSVTVTGLTPGLGFYFAFEATNSSGVRRSGGQYAIVSPERPTVVQSSGGNQTGYAVRLSATVNAQGSNTRWSFRYSTDPQLLSGVTELAATPYAVTGATNTSVTLAVSGLQPSTWIWYQVVGKALTGPAVGETILGPIQSVQTLNVSTTTTVVTTTTKPIVTTTKPTTTTTPPSTTAPTTTTVPGSRAQTISFAPISDREFGPGVRVTATASSGLPVTFSVTTPSVCRILTLTDGVAVQTVEGLADVDTATCTVVAAQAGNGTYAAATSVSRSFTWRKAATKIWLSAVPKLYLKSGTGGVIAYWGMVDPVLMSGLYSLNSILSATSLSPSTCAVTSTTLVSTTNPYTRVIVQPLALGTCTLQVQYPGGLRRMPVTATWQLAVV